MYELSTAPKTVESNSGELTAFLFNYQAIIKNRTEIIHVKPWASVNVFWLLLYEGSRTWKSECPAEIWTSYQGLETHDAAATATNYDVESSQSLSMFDFVTFQSLMMWRYVGDAVRRESQFVDECNRFRRRPGDDFLNELRQTSVRQQLVG